MSIKKYIDPNIYAFGSKLVKDMENDIVREPDTPLWKQWRCRIFGHRFFMEMSSHPQATAGWLRCDRCKGRL